MTTSIPGVIHKRLDRFTDQRGSSVEVFRAVETPDGLVQANHSRSKAGVIRGLHYHRNQADLWYVASGEVRAALVDLRTRTQRPVTALVEMSSDEPATLYIPPGVAHGFAAVTDCDLIYWVTHTYDASDEFGVSWDDATLAIDWGVESPILSERDRSNPPLRWDEIL